MNKEQKKIFKAVLSKGYFPKELPSNFEILRLEDFVDLEPTAFAEKEKPFFATSHNVTRSRNLTRKLDIPHPLAYYRLVKEMVENLNLLLDHKKKKSPYCLSYPDVDNEEFGRAFVWEHDWQSWKEDKIKKQSGYRYFLRTDISNFYPSIYTHIVPWVIEGKEIAKARRLDKKLLGNKLDAKIRNCQDSQTQGLPIGPDASFVISEVILNHLDSKILEELKSRNIDHRGTRFVDDYEFYFNSDIHAKQALQVITRILNDYELFINPLKTQVGELPVDFEKEWVVEIRTRQVTGATDKTKRQIVVDYFNYILQLQKKHPEEQVLSYALARVEIHQFLIDDKELLFSLLMNLVFYDSSIIKWLIHFINLDISVLEDSNVKRSLARSVPKLLADCSDRGRDNDVLWCLILIYLFDIKINEELSNSVFENGNALK